MVLGRLGRLRGRGSEARHAPESVIVNGRFKRKKNTYTSGYHTWGMSQPMLLPLWYTMHM